MAYDHDWIVVAVGTWFYDRSVPREIKLLARPAELAASRWTEDEAGRFVLNDGAPVPETADGLIYCVGATSGGEFPSAADAVAWADRQPWGPVEWAFLQESE